MRTVKCDKHDTLIVVLKSSEEYIFSDNLMATVVFYDASVGPYLKRYFFEKCTDDCSTVKKIFKKLRAEATKDALTELADE